MDEVFRYLPYVTVLDAPESCPARFGSILRKVRFALYPVVQLVDGYPHLSLALLNDLEFSFINQLTR